MSTRSRAVPWFKAGASRRLVGADQERVVDGLTLPEKSDCYAKDGRRISLLEWTILGRQPSYCVIGRADFGPAALVSTVWLGLDHGFMGGAPVIFETMSRHRDGWELLGRYVNEEAARYGHARAVEEFLAAHPELKR